MTIIICITILFARVSVEKLDIRGSLVYTLIKRLVDKYIFVWSDVTTFTRVARTSELLTQQFIKLYLIPNALSLSNSIESSLTSETIHATNQTQPKNRQTWEIDGKCQKNWTYACMHEYVKSLVRSSPDHFILHVCTNDLSSDKSPEKIARSIIDLVTSIKNEKHDVSISNIIIRAGDKKLEEKWCEVNSFLGKLCKENNCYLIDNFTRTKRNH